MDSEIDAKTFWKAIGCHGNHFAINYAPKGRDDLAKEFGGGGALKGADRFKARRLGGAQDRRADLGGFRGRHRLQARGDDRAPRHRHRVGPGSWATAPGPRIR